MYTALVISYLFVIGAAVKHDALVSCKKIEGLRALFQASLFPVGLVSQATRETHCAAHPVEPSPVANLL